MAENKIVITLSDGTEVLLQETWNCCDDWHDCGSCIEVYDKEDGKLITTISDSLPDMDDEDFNMDDFIKLIENNL